MLSDMAFTTFSALSGGLNPYYNGICSPTAAVVPNGDYKVVLILIIMEYALRQHR